MPQDTLIQRLEQVICPSLGSGARMPAGEYDYIPLPIDAFETQLKIAKGFIPFKKGFNPKFIDVGCGLGTKVFLADHFGCHAYGIEKCDEYIPLAQKIVAPRVTKYWPPRKDPEPVIIHGDALTFDRYDEFDIIYFYCPLSDHQKETKLELKLFNDAKVGTVFMANMCQHKLWYSRARSVWDDKIFIKER